MVDLGRTSGEHGGRAEGGGMLSLAPLAPLLNVLLIIENKKGTTDFQKHQPEIANSGAVVERRH
jgi:hypothetical protein